MENINLKSHNYQFTDRQIKEIHNKMDFLFKQIPFDSRVSLDFDYKDKVFYGKLKVDFYGKIFVSKGSSHLLGSLTAVLCKKTIKQVMKWKKTRTIEEITGIIAFEHPRKMGKTSDFSAYKKVG